MSRISHALQSTKSVFSVKWRPKEVKIPAWVISAFLWITTIRSISYGVELLFLVTNNPITPMMAYAALFGIQLWGVLMLVAVAVLIIGLVSRLTILISIGSLLCAAVWLSFAVVLCLGFIGIGTGGRFAVAALATGCTWVLFFWIQLKSLRRSIEHA